MNKSKQLRLSRFTVPELSIGRAPLTPQNSQFDSRRLQYLEGMVVYLDSLLENLKERYSPTDALSRLEQLLVRLPYSDLVEISSGGKPVVREIPTARDRIGFHHEHLKITFLDGLHRRAQNPSIPAGRSSPDVSRVISCLSCGISEGDLSRIFEECQLDFSSVIEGLREIQFIEEVDSSAESIPRSLLEGKKERLSWLGHACILFQSASSSVCVDPFLRPHIRWTERDMSSCFSESYGDHFFFEPYGPELTQLSPAELPPLDAVFLTHQDIDHCNLGVLMMLPENVPIVVPDCDSNHMWEVDLSALVHKVLGRRRKVIRLKHGETLTFGEIRATAFPFYSEMPSSLETLWNCYLFETDHAAVACTADSAITDESVDFLIQQLRGKRKPFVLCARLVHSGTKSAGHRDEIENLYNFTRLWAWYMPLWDLFQPVEASGISESRLHRLSRETNLRFYLPYAMGTTPWFRIADVNDPLHVPMANLSARDVLTLSETLQRIPQGPRLFPGKFAQPFSIGDA